MIVKSGPPEEAYEYSVFALAIAGLIIATVHAAAQSVTTNLQDAKGQSFGMAVLTDPRAV
jgi:hypothetical protein